MLVFLFILVILVKKKCQAVRTLVTSCRVDVVCLQETKMAAVSRGTILSMLGSDFTNWVQLPSVGASGGILIAWRHGLDRAQASRIDQYSVSTQFSTSDLQPWWLTCVYGPQGDDNKILFLQEIKNLRAGCQGPGLVVGDFNLITSVEDKNNGNINRAMVGRICSFGLSLGLREFPPFSPLRPPSFREFFVWSSFGLAQQREIFCVLLGSVTVPLYL